MQALSILVGIVIVGFFLFVCAVLWSVLILARRASDD